MAALAKTYMEGIWFDQPKVEAAECMYQQYLANRHGKEQSKTPQKKEGDGHQGVAQQIADARQKIQSLKTTQQSPSKPTENVQDKINLLEKENADMQNKIESLTNRFIGLEARISVLEGAKAAPSSQSSSQPKPEVKKVTPLAEESDSDSESDSDFDILASDEETEEQKKIRQERLAQYAAKKAKKPGPIAKSNIVLDVKPWDDETDMAEMEKKVRSIETDGLLWGASVFKEVAFGIQKLSISCVVEDDKVGTEFLEEQITAFDDLVQSVDVAAFNKV